LFYYPQQLLEDGLFITDARVRVRVRVVVVVVVVVVVGVVGGGAE